MAVHRMPFATKMTVTRPDLNVKLNRRNVTVLKPFTKQDFPSIEA